MSAKTAVLGEAAGRLLGLHLDVADHVVGEHCRETRAVDPERAPQLKACDRWLARVRQLIE
jgi:hypothetical protein